MSNLMNSNDLEQLAEHAQEAAALLKQLSNQHRLMILCSLIDSELSVTELNSRTNLSQSALSQHLASLRNAGLVQTRREAQTIFYQLQGNEAIQVIRVLKSIYCP
ncbi:metalloregulator ArsR/SmtB family transcription factor [SAR92 clade bacterium H231]|jgi:DNA-binding transcriptional ArsR family regulator|nr:metalloregulator ArsR/SmtB family transcription factor [SAR92 clade bacterium H231]